MMSAATLDTVMVEPIVTYPRTAVVGFSYPLTIDLRPLSSTMEWPYEQEEYVVNCEIDTAPFFSYEPLDEPAIVLHRFGGTYGPARFLLTANEIADGKVTTAGNMWITVADEWGTPITTLKLTDIQIFSAHASLLAAATTAIDTSAQQIESSIKNSPTGGALSDSQRDDAILTTIMPNQIVPSTATTDFDAEPISPSPMNDDPFSSPRVAPSDIERSLRILTSSDSSREQEQAWTQLWDAYSGRLYRYSRIRLDENHVLAESVASETFTTAWQAITRGTFHAESEPQFTMWLYTLCRNTIRRAQHEIIRDRKTREPGDVEDTYLSILARLDSQGRALPPSLVIPDNADAATSTIVEVERLKSAFKNLTQRQRQCLLLSAHGYRRPEIAQRLGISEGAVNSNISLGRKKLRGLLVRDRDADTGDLPRARASYEESLAHQLGDQRVTRAELHELALLARQTGDVARARAVYEEALALARQLGDQHAIAIELHSLGALDIEEGHVASARERLSEALAIATTISDAKTMTDSESALADLEQQ